MTVNVGVVDLGHVDLLVQEGFYSNRSDLIRTALRNQLALHADAVERLQREADKGVDVQPILADVKSRPTADLSLDRVAAAASAIRPSAGRPFPIFTIFPASIKTSVFAKFPSFSPVQTVAFLIRMVSCLGAWPSSQP